MAIAHVGTSGHTTTASLAYTPASTSNILLVTTMLIGSVAQPTISDTAGNTFNLYQAWTSANGIQITGWWVKPNGTASTTITIAGLGSSSFQNILVDEFSGCDTASPINQHNTATGATAGGTMSLTPNRDNCALYGAIGDSVSALGSGFTLGANDGSGDETEWKILVGGGNVSQTINFTGSGAWLMLGTVLSSPLIVVTNDITSENQLYRDTWERDHNDDFTTRYTGRNITIPVVAYPHDNDYDKNYDYQLKDHNDDLVQPFSPTFDWTHRLDYDKSYDPWERDHNDDLAQFPVPLLDWTYPDEQERSFDVHEQDHNDDLGALPILPFNDWTTDSENQELRDTHLVDVSSDDNASEYAGWFVPAFDPRNTGQQEWDQRNIDTHVQDDSSDPAANFFSEATEWVDVPHDDEPNQLYTDYTLKQTVADEGIEAITINPSAWDDPHDQANRDYHVMDHTSDDEFFVAWHTVIPWNPALGGGWDDEPNQMNTDRRQLDTSSDDAAYTFKGWFHPTVITILWKDRFGFEFQRFR